MDQEPEKDQVIIRILLIKKTPHPQHNFKKTCLKVNGINLIFRQILTTTNSIIGNLDIFP